MPQKRKNPDVDGSSSDLGEPKVGLGQITGRGYLADLEYSFEAGDEWAWIAAMCHCAAAGTPMPQWVAARWVEAAGKAQLAEIRSWDEVLPKVIPSGRGRRQEGKRLEVAYAGAVFVAVQLAMYDRMIKKQDKREAIDDALFERLTEENGWPFSPGTAKRLYYATRYRLSSRNLIRPPQRRLQPASGQKAGKSTSKNSGNS